MPSHEPPIENSLESYLDKPIACRPTSRLVIPKDCDAANARRFVRRKTAECCRLDDMKGAGQKGDPLNFKINGFLRALQIEILETEGWPSAKIRQEARDALQASMPKDSPEIRAYFERLWGPLKNAVVTDPSWPPSTNRKIDVGGHFPEPD